MADRTIAVRLKAEYAGFKAAMKDVRNESANTAATLDRHGNKITSTSGRIVRSAEVNREAWSTAGTTLTAFGVAGVAALGLSAKAAIDWESAWTGVLKTVEGSHDQLAQLEDDLRGMALEMPASAAEIAGVAEAAGQLGVKVDDVAEFTRVMVNLGETTNLTADEAATALARISNIMGTSADDVDRMGATIVDLGNNAATTEAEIVALATRLAAAGKQAGLSEADVFAFASTLTSVGVEAEAGGTALSKVFTAINDAVIDGGDKLDTFARIAGVSSSDFRKAYEQDAAGTIASFIDGMGRLSDSGESTTQVFDDLELTDQRLKRAILSTGSAAGLLTDQLDIANTAWDENTALIEEAAKRYDTTEAKISIAKNAINEAAISIGENLLPMVASMAEGVAGAAEAFANFSPQTQGAITSIAATASVTGLAAGAFLLLFPRVLETVDGMRRIGAISPRAASGLGRVVGTATKMAGVFAGIVIAAEALKTGIDAAADASLNAVPSVSELTQALLDTGDAAAALDKFDVFSTEQSAWNEFVVGAKTVDDLADAFAALEKPAKSVFDALTSGDWGSIGPWGDGTSRADFDQSVEAINALDEALAGLVSSGAAGRASDALDSIAEAAGLSRRETRAFLPAYVESLADADVQQALTADSADDLAGSTDALTDSTENYVDALTESIELQREAAGVALDERSAWRDFKESIDDASDALEDNGHTLSSNTDEGRANQQALDDLVRSVFAWVEAGDAAGVSQEDLQGRMRAGRQSFIDAATDMGMSEDAAKDLADQLGLIPSNVQSAVQVTGLEDAQRKLDNFLRANSGKTIRIATGIGGTGGITRASGGPVYGAGSATSDSIPAWLSNGEYVQKASAHSFWGTRAMDAMNRQDVSGMWQALASRGFAGGGPVMASGPAASPSVTVNPSISIGPELAAFADHIVSGVLDGSRRIARGEINGQARDVIAGRR